MKYLAPFLIIMITLYLPLQACAQSERTAGETPVATNDNNKPDPDDVYRHLNLFGDVFEQVREKYVEEVDDKELIENAINGMLASLDPHSAYLNEDDFEEMRVQTRGEFGGLGIEVTMENGFVKVVSPIDDTPAFAAGIKAGDLITHLNGQPVMGMTLSEAVDIMRGKVGTEIELTVVREGENEPLYIKIIRDIIRIQAVKNNIFKDSVGYIRITTFNQNAEEGVKEAVNKIKSELSDNLIGYIIDLRNNPGGLLDQAIGVSDIFLDQGEIVSTRGRRPSDTERDNAYAGDMAAGLPIIVIVNGGSASASEIVAGALQDHRRALIIGTQTFGKGSVQSIIPIAGRGAMRLTTARYYTPSGRSIQAKGIEPDIEVELAKLETLEYRRTSEADLKGALDNGLPANDNTSSKKDKTKDDAKKTKEEENAELLQKDYQLARAVDLLRGLSMYNGKVVNSPEIKGDKKEGS